MTECLPSVKFVLQAPTSAASDPFSASPLTKSPSSEKKTKPFGGKATVFTTADTQAKQIDSSVNWDGKPKERPYMEDPKHRMQVDDKYRVGERRAPPKREDLWTQKKKNSLWKDMNTSLLFFATHGNNNYPDHVERIRQILITRGVEYQEIDLCDPLTGESLARLQLGGVGSPPPPRETWEWGVLSHLAPSSRVAIARVRHCGGERNRDRAT